MLLKSTSSLLLTAAAMIAVEAAGLTERLLPEVDAVTRRLVVGALAGLLFLLLLLLFSVRRDPLAVLAQRLERFRVRLLEEVAVTPGGLDRGRWRRELQSHKDEVRTRLLAGARRLSRGRRRRAEAMFEVDWQRIVELIERRAAAATALLDGAAIERLIEAAMEPVAAAPRSADRAPVSDRRPVLTSPLPVGDRPTRQPPREPPAVAEQVLSLEPAAFLAAVAAARRSVVLEGGVYRVRQELYGADRPAPRDPTERRGLRRVTEESAVTDQRLQELMAAGRSAAARQLPVTPLGADLDQLLAGESEAHTTAVRARVLERLRASMEAAGAALLIEHESGYRSAVTCGNLGHASGELQFGRGNPLYDTCLVDRRYLIAAAGAGRGLAGASGQRYAFVPAILDESRAYLVFLSRSAPTPVQWHWEFLITRLALHPS